MLSLCGGVALNGAPLPSSLYSNQGCIALENSTQENISLRNVSLDKRLDKSNLNSAKNLNIIKAEKIGDKSIRLQLCNEQNIIIDFYNTNIFRVFLDPKGGQMRAPVAEPPAEILCKNAQRSFGGVNLSQSGKTLTISTSTTKIEIDNDTCNFLVINLKNGKVVTEYSLPNFDKNGFSLSMPSTKDEYFFGGGVQNGRFSHKGKLVSIVNENSWTDGGVASPNPFFWSTKGYGVMFHTFKPGAYNFDNKNTGKITLSHDDSYMDMFIMVDQKPEDLLADFYQLTGNPVLVPEFGFYEGHLNAYNRDYWKENEKGVLFEDGKRYKESQKDDTGIKESLNGELDNYQFSARAVVDRYAAHDMPLGWVLPNDGYGAGYGQTETLDGNIANLKSFGDYAREHGVEIGLWTQSDLHPKEGVSALLQRDIVKEVGTAGVRVLKTDVAWVGAGYSFGLNGVSDAGEIMKKYGNDARSFIISLDGWAGTQRYATIWSGDQTGGEWEYIRFHIPTYLGSGLSGQPNICSDMDGIFGGQNPIVNTRDYQWKAFTLMQLNMDGWGRNEKYPHALGEPATSINRNYLKHKSELLPYVYTVAHESVYGKPSMRAMLVDYPNEYTLGVNTQYQYTLGSDLLIAPIYQNTKADEDGNDIRNNIYLPEGQWVDYYDGTVYDGNVILNYYDSPLWKLPVFVRNGAIIPMSLPNNNLKEADRSTRVFEIYPHGESEFSLYEDDGRTNAYYTNKEFATTKITSSINEKGSLNIVTFPTEGSYKGQIVEKSSIYRINLASMPKKVKAYANGKRVKLSLASSLEEFNAGDNVYFFNAAPELNRFSTEGSEAAKFSVKKNPQLLIKIAKVNTKETKLEIDIRKFTPLSAGIELCKTGEVTSPEFAINEGDIEPYSLNLKWSNVENADFYEIEFDNMLYTTIYGTELKFENLAPETNYEFKLRSVNKDGHSSWVSKTIETQKNPLEFAIKGISGRCSAKSQGGEGVNNLFNFESNSNLWHTKYGNKVELPADLVMNLGSYNTLDKLVYLPRKTGRNGLILRGSVLYSRNGKDWKDAGEFKWRLDNTNKEFIFEEKVEARFIKLHITKSYGGYLSGREIYVFKEAGSTSYVPGDINIDGKVDMNDIMSYTNYTGLRQGDGDFEGYISKGDVNGNGIIDVFDIATAVDRMNHHDKIQLHVDGEIEIDYAANANKGQYEVIVNGKDLKFVNALGCALAYDKDSYEFVGVKDINMKKMDNLTNNRLHTSGDMVLYPTFINVKLSDPVEGDGTLFKLIFKAKGQKLAELQKSSKSKQLKVVAEDLQVKDILLLDENLEVKEIKN